jgi:hypothetical protein
MTTDNTENEETVSSVSSSSAVPAALAPQTFSMDDIVETYNVLANVPTDYANALMERQGQAQASYGPLAEQAMGTSRTPEQGIGNYTYNRSIRPTVDTLRDEMIVRGLSEALNKQLNDSLKKAKSNYAKSGGGGNTNNTKTDADSTTITGSEDISEGGGTSTKPSVVTNKYRVTQYDPATGEEIGSTVYTRPEFMDDQDWYDLTEMKRKRLKSNEKMEFITENENGQ